MKARDAKEVDPYGMILDEDVLLEDEIEKLVKESIEKNANR